MPFPLLAVNAVYRGVTKIRGGLIFKSLDEKPKK
jgi:hypothetical protein